MSDKIKRLKDHVVNVSSDEDFVHHKWFIKYHLEIVHAISMELSEIYDKSDPELIEVMVWLHDYGKILDYNNQEEMLFKEGRKLLENLEFNDEFINKVMGYLQLFEKKMEVDLSNSPIEVKIVSSADAASHFFGPFFFLWWYENPEKDFEDLMKDNMAKAEKDWYRKIVLPEVKTLIKDRYKYLLEQAGNLPDKYFISS
jgi:hypothetical protein